MEPGSSSSIFLSHMDLVAWCILYFHTNFSIFYYSSVENAIDNLIRDNLTGIALNLYIALGSIVILTILTLPIQKHSISFHLFVSSSIPFISLLQFSEYRCFISLCSFMPRHFILLDAVVNEIVSLISLWSVVVSVQKCKRFLCINAVSCDITKFIDKLQQFSGGIFRIFYV